MEQLKAQEIATVCTLYDTLVGQDFTGEYSGEYFGAN